MSAWLSALLVAWATLTLAKKVGVNNAVNGVGGSASAKGVVSISQATLLLPINSANRVEFTLEGHNGCFMWCAI